LDLDRIVGSLIEQQRDCQTDRTGNALMKNWPQDEESILARFAGIQSVLDRLEEDFQASTWRKSPRVSKCIQQANEELELAIKRFTEDDREESIHMANLAWLHVQFGRRLIDAETTEGLLGEGHFLELGEDKAVSAALLVKYFSRMQQAIVDLRTAVKNRLEGQ
jgi:hypothetical protein